MIAAEERVGAADDDMERLRGVAGRIGNGSNAPRGSDDGVARPQCEHVPVPRLAEGRSGTLRAVGGDPTTRLTRREREGLRTSRGTTTHEESPDLRSAHGQVIPVVLFCADVSAQQCGEQIQDTLSKTTASLENLGNAVRDRLALALARLSEKEAA